MNDKTILITGGTDGIGKQAALELSQMGANVVIIGRNAEKLTNTRSEIAERSEHMPATIQADLSEQGEVRRAASEFKARFKRLDVLINNAGNGFYSRQLTGEGIERTWALNHMAYFILTLELLDLLKASAPARIINTSSSANYRGRIHFVDVELTHNYKLMRAYCQSKLANVMFTLALARRLEGSSVTATVLHPGLVRTAIGSTGNTFLAKLVQPLIFRRGISVEEGTRTTIYLASSPEVEGINGKFFIRCKEVEANQYAYIEEDQERLWALSESYLIPPIDAAA